MKVKNKYVRRANIQYALILAIVVGIAIYMNIEKSKDSRHFQEPEIVEEFIESIPSEMP